MKRYESDVYEPRDFDPARMAWHDGFSAGVSWGFVCGIAVVGLLWWLT